MVNKYISMIPILMLEIQLKILTFCFKDCVWAGFPFHFSSGYTDKIEQNDGRFKFTHRFAKKRCELYSTATINVV